MKLSERTIGILKSFSAINSGLWFNQGNILSTISAGQSILAKAEIEETFPVSFGIYDMNNFLSVLSLHKDGAELEFDTHHVLIQGFNGKSKIKYRFTEKKMLTTPPDKTLTLPSVDISFQMNEKQYGWIINTAKVLMSPHIAAKNDGTTGLFLTTYDGKDDSAHQQSLEISDVEEPNGATYVMTWAADNFSKIIPSTYNVEISKKGISKFVSEDTKLEYFIALEKDYNSYRI